MEIRMEVFKIPKYLKLCKNERISICNLLYFQKLFDLANNSIIEESLQNRLRCFEGFEELTKIFSIPCRVVPSKVRDLGTP